MSRPRTIVAIATMALVVACTDNASFVAPTPDESATQSPNADPMLSVLDASGPTGIEGFYFMPPIDRSAPDATDLDASLLDDLVVEVCEWDGSVCVEPLAARITSESEMAERLHVSEEAVYHTTWDTRGADVEVGQFYRVRVLASGRELGRVDVEIIAPRDAGSAGDYEHVRLIRGQALPVGFVIEVGTLERVGPEGGTIELADGMITLDVPAGAVSEDVLLTAVPATDLPTGGPPIVPGTAWNFGPDGTVFDVPITMTIGFNLVDVPSGVDPNELRIHKVADGEFVQQDAGLVDLENEVISARVSGFSVFVVIPRDPLNPEDVVAPVVESMQVLDPGTGVYDDAVALDVSAGDAVLGFRISITDNITGVGQIAVSWLSPSGGQLRQICSTGVSGVPPDDGSDTNGQWNCPAPFPQYSEAGVWQPYSIYVDDGVRNQRFYRPGPGGFCDRTDDAQCVESIPQITIVSDPQDITPPVLQSFEVSLNTQPRSFAPSLEVDSEAGPHPIVFGFRATDDLSGVGGVYPGDYVYMGISGPGGQGLSRPFACNLTGGTTFDGFWECDPFTFIRQYAQVGTWTVSYIRVPDRAGNGTFTGQWTQDGSGQLCNSTGSCVPQPVVEVTGTGDDQPPTLVGLGISLVGSDVSTQVILTDDVSGAQNVFVQYNSTETTQFRSCIASPVLGTPTAGAWACTIAFSEFAARGQWTLGLFVQDSAGNYRSYQRRDSDGAMCYFDQAGTEVCQDFGDTDIILQ